MPDPMKEARAIIDEADAGMAELFVRRMKAVQKIYDWKERYGLPVRDRAREEAVIARNTEKLGEEELKESP